MSVQVRGIKRTRNIYYCGQTSMSYSFDTLVKIARDQLGAQLQEGDLVVFENTKQTTRKVLMMTQKGLMIYHARLHQPYIFTAMASKNGKVETKQKGSLL